MAADLVPDISRRWREEALAGDLRLLSREVPPGVGIAYAGDAASVAGALYVLEGSRLGSKVLLRHLETCLPGLPSQFLSHGMDRPLWQSFVGWLNSEKWTPEDLAVMRGSAASVFRAYLSACDDGD